MVILEDCSSSSSSPSSSSFSSTQPWIYDVFLSFRGTDYRNKFIAHLHNALCRKGIRSYIDDDLKIGEEISETLCKAIEDSSIAIIVFSKNYADSRWCLDELIKILECKEKKQQMVVPIFYDVEPSEVRKQTGSVKEAFAKLEARFMDDEKLQRWKRALEEVGNLAGFHLLPNRKESEFIQEIIQKLGPRIANQAYLDVAKYPVGIEFRVQQVNLLLEVGMNNIRMVGITGTGGIGKTTIAKAIYNLIAYQFDGSCFLSNIRETCEESNGLVHLQNELLSKVLGNSSLLVDMVDRGITMIKRSLNSKKTLIVLDDVDQLVQLEKLVGECEWFGLGSRIVITTRDKGLLTKHGVDLIYHVDGFNGDEALELFSWNAFKKKTPNDDFVELSQKVVGYAGGIPLALEVMGSNLFSKSLCEWQSIFEKYKVILHGDIEKILKVSYVGLAKEDKNIFLDIACFFKGCQLDYVSRILDKCGFFPDCGIQELVNKSLISISKYNCLEMHDLVQQMGREMVRLESPDPGKRSRLWHHEDIRRVLRDNTGTSKIEGILVTFPKGEQMHLNLNPKVFKKMKNLRLFLNYNTTFSTTPKFLSNELRVLYWSGFPGEIWPSNFCGENLIGLIIERSNLKTYHIIQNFRNLEWITFHECKYLREIPDLSMISNLKSLNFIDCENLEVVHHSVSLHDKLLNLEFMNCPNLKSFSRSLRLRSLMSLYIFGCPNLRPYPEFDCSMEHLGHVLVADNPWPSPWKVTQCKGHVPTDCQNVENVLNIISSSQSRSFVKSTNVSNICRSFPMASGCFPRLSYLDLSRTNIVSLPTCIQNCCQLHSLHIACCQELKEVSRLPPYLQYFNAYGCESLEKIRLDARDSPWLCSVALGSCQMLKDIGNDVQSFVSRERHASMEEKHNKQPELEFLFPGYEVPYWFSYKKAVDGEINVIDLSNLDGEIEGIAFCFVYKIQNIEILKPIDSLEFRIEVICDGSKIYQYHQCFYSPFTLGNTCLIYKSFESFKLKGDGVQVYFHYKAEGPILGSCGVHLVRRDEDKAAYWIPNPTDEGNILEDIHDDFDGSDDCKTYRRQKRFRFAP